MSIDLSMYEDASVAEVEAAITEVLGESLRDALGPAYGEVEELIVLTMIGMGEGPEQDETLRKMKAQWGDERAALLGVSMALLVKAQAREQQATSGGDDAVRH